MIIVGMMPSLEIHIMWEGLVDYSRLKWQHVLQQFRNTLSKIIGSLNFLIGFQCPHHAICQQEIEMMLLAPLLGASFPCLFGFGYLGLVVLWSTCVYYFMFAMELVHLFQIKTSSQWDYCSMNKLDKKKKKVVWEHVIPFKFISTPHR